MARLAVAIMVLLVAGAYAQPARPTPSPKPATSPSPAAGKPAPADATAAVADKPAANATAGGQLDPIATAAIDDAIARSRPTLRGRDAQKVLDNMKEPLTKVAEAKAAGVPVQLAVSRSVTDVQSKVPLNPQSRQAVLDAAYRVYTTSPAKLAPAKAPKPDNATAGNDTMPAVPETEGAANATNTTMADDMAAANATDAANTTAPEAPITDAGMDNTTAPLDANTTEPAAAGDNATEPAGAGALPGAKGGDSKGAAAAAPSPSPKPTKSSASLQLVSSSVLALLAAVVAVLL